MTDYHDHYFDADDANTFLPLLAEQPNIIGPRFGTLEVAGTNPARVYIAVRGSQPIETPIGAEVTPPEIATSLLGVWA